MRYLKEVTTNSLEHIAFNMRKADRVECDAAAGVQLPEVHIENSVGVSDLTYIINTPHDEPMAVCGIVYSEQPRYAVVWMMGTDQIRHHYRFFVRNSKESLASLMDSLELDVLFNFTHIDNHVHHRWLGWLGARFYDARPYGVNGEQFIPFTINRKGVECVNPLLSSLE